MKLLKYLGLFLWLASHAAEAPAANTAGIGLVLGVEGQYIVVRGIVPDSPLVP